VKEIRPVFRQVPTVAMLVLAALGSLAISACSVRPGSPQPAAVREEIVLDLGNGVKLEMLLIPAGEFQMGSPTSDTSAEADEMPRHAVRISRPFYLGKYPVTQEQWRAVMGGNSGNFKGPRNPVEQVSWHDCQQFLEKLNAKLGTQDGKFALPSEAQWEYACRAGSTTRYCFGEDDARLGEYAWYAASTGGATHPVGEKRPNAWGLYDMHGNVCEWCQDWFGEDYYAKSPPHDPPGPAAGSFRVARGGNWDDPAWYCRSAFRTGGGPGERYEFLGLRVCRAAAK
jgi:formylglycine-generating enzyme required for sulfatase activity